MGNSFDEEKYRLLSYQSKRHAMYGEHSRVKSASSPSLNERSIKTVVNLNLEDEVFNSKENLLLSGEFQLPSKIKHYVGYLKIAVLLVVWMFCCYALMVKREQVAEVHQLIIPKGATKGYLVTQKPTHHHLMVTIEGAFVPLTYANMSNNWMHVCIELLIAKDNPKNPTNFDSKKIIKKKNISETWVVPLVSEKLIGAVPEITLQKYFDLATYDCAQMKYCFLNVEMITNLKANFPVSVGYNLEPINVNEGVIYAAFVLLFLYFLIVFELVHKTLAAVIASTLSVSILAVMNARPTMEEIISWIDIDTLLLLFSMMVLVAIFSETGFFDYMAVVAYKITSGKIWPLINTLCFFTAALSCFLDNVTTALLMTPVTIRLCEVMRIDPVPVLIKMVIYSNIGGAITPIGDPPNVLIASNPAVLQSGINFGVFTLHMGVGVILAAIAVYIQLRIKYRNINDLKSSEPNDVHDLRREIEVWRRTAASMGSYSKDESSVKNLLMKRMSRLVGQLNIRTSYKSPCTDAYTENLKDLQARYPIKDRVLLVKSGIAMAFVICVFFLHSLPEFNRLGLAWTALLGAILLLILCGRDDMEAIFAKVEWSTLLFFASLFVLMEALSRLGLINWIGHQTETVIMSVGQEARMSVAILLILWVSALASAFVDNIPLTTMMIKIVTSLADNRELGLPLQPLIWALSFGACLGVLIKRWRPKKFVEGNGFSQSTLWSTMIEGNGTLFGSSCNIVCAGVAEQHGYKFSFMQFMKVGFPVMLTSTCVITVYLLVSHVVCVWH